MLNSPKIGLLGQLLDTKLDAKELENCSVCELSDILKQKILHRLLIAELDPEVSVMIDGETWDRAGIVDALRRLYNWADSLCGKEDKSVAVFSSNTRCGKPSC